MPRRRRRKPVEKARRIIHTCRMVEERGLNPFNVEVKEELERLNKHLGELETYEELCIDAEAVNMLTKIVKSQGDWLSDEASTFYMDPVFVERKLQKAPPEAIAEVFMKAWRPLACLQEISKEKLKEAIDYWNRLKPLKSRWSRFRRVYKTRGLINFEELKQRGIVADEMFYKSLEKVFEELKDLYESHGSVSYWSFIAEEDFKKTVKKAYMLSFLSTYGYVEFEKIPLEDDYLIRPRKPSELKGFPESLPISIDYERWRKLSKEGVSVG